MRFSVTQKTSPASNQRTLAIIEKAPSHIGAFSFSESIISVTIRWADEFGDEEAKLLGCQDRS